MPDAEFAVRELLREQIDAALEPHAVLLNPAQFAVAVDAVVEAVASLMPFDVGRAAAAEVAGLQLGRDDEPDELTSRMLLDRAVAAAIDTPNPWAPHVWAQLAAAATAVERGEREQEGHELSLQWQRQLVAPPARAGLPVAPIWRETIAAALEEPDNVPAWVQALVDAVGDPGALLDVLDGNDVAVPPWLVDGLQAAAAERETLDVEFVQPPGPDSVPDWVVALVDAAAGGRPLDFAGAVVPAWVQERLERGVADGTLGTVPAGGTS